MIQEDEDRVLAKEGVAVELGRRSSLGSAGERLKQPKLAAFSEGGADQSSCMRSHVPVDWVEFENNRVFV